MVNVDAATWGRDKLKIEIVIETHVTEIRLD